MAVLTAVFFGLIFMFYAVMASPYSIVPARSLSIPEDIIIRLFTLMPLGNISYRHALASAFCAAFAMLCVYQTAVNLNSLMKVKNRRTFNPAMAMSLLTIALSPQFMHLAATAGGVRVLLAFSFFMLSVSFGLKHTLFSKNIYIYISFAFSGAAAAVYQPFGAAAALTSLIVLMHSYKKNAFSRILLSFAFFAVSYTAMNAGGMYEIPSFTVAKGDGAVVRLTGAFSSIVNDTFGAFVFMAPFLYVFFRKRRRFFWGSLTVSAALFILPLISESVSQMHISESAVREARLAVLPFISVSLLMGQSYVWSVSKKIVLYIFCGLCAASFFTNTAKYSHNSDFTHYQGRKMAVRLNYGKEVPEYSRAKSAQAIIGEAMLQADLGKKDKAERMIDMALKYCPREPSVLLKAAEAYFGPMNEHLTGLLYLDMALETEPYDAELAKVMIKKAREYGDTARAGRWTAHYVIRLKGSPADLK